MLANVTRKSDMVEIFTYKKGKDQPTYSILKAKSNFTLLSCIPFMGIGE